MRFAPAFRQVKRLTHRLRGVTLIEALVVLAILGILVAVAVAVYQRSSGQQPPHNAAKHLVAAMERAQPGGGTQKRRLAGETRVREARPDTGRRPGA
jgi:prepilin-type N-terminal cleavage/methylation domain-containing protein